MHGPYDAAMVELPESTFAALVSSDVERYTGRPGSWAVAVVRGMQRPGLWASLIVRAQQRLTARGRHRLAGLLRGVGVALVGIDVTPGARIGPGVRFEHPVGIVIGNGVVIGRGATINQGVTLGMRDSAEGAEVAYPVIGDDVIVGARSSVLGGVHVGDGAVVGAHSLVLADVAPGARVIGVPARPLS